MFDLNFTKIQEGDYIKDVRWEEYALVTNVRYNTNITGLFTHKTSAGRYIRPWARNIENTFGYVIVPVDKVPAEVLELLRD